MTTKKTIKNKSAKTVKKARTNVASGRIYVTATFNNTLVTLTDQDGKTLTWSSSGASGFKGARKATPFAGISAVDTVASKAKELGMGVCEVYIKGPGPGRDAAIRALKNAGMNISMIADITPMPHNGPRAKKRRRV